MRGQKNIKFTIYP